MQNKVSGVYIIRNSKDVRVYIGSSKNIIKRFGDHMSALLRNKHINPEMQKTYDEFGMSSFTLDILEICTDISKLYDVEQKYLDEYSEKPLYNRSRTSKGCSTTDTSVSVYLLTLDGAIYGKYPSSAAIARSFNVLRGINYSAINTESIFLRKFRIVTADFYKSNMAEILKWKPYTSETAEKNKERSFKFNSNKYKVVKDEVETCFHTKKSLAIFIGLTHQRVNQIFKDMDSRGVRKYFHKKTCFSIQYVD